MNLGQFIISTKNQLLGIFLVKFILNLFWMGVGLFAFVLYVFGTSTFRYSNFTYLLVIALISFGGGLICFLLNRKSYGSYVDVYENGIVCFVPGTPKAELPYSDIQSISVNGLTIMIQTRYTDYKVKAFKNRQAAVNAIQQRIQETKAKEENK